MLSPLRPSRTCPRGGGAGAPCHTRRACRGRARVAAPPPPRARPGRRLGPVPPARTSSASAGTSPRAAGGRAPCSAAAATTSSTATATSVLRSQGARMRPAANLRAPVAVPPPLKLPPRRPTVVRVSERVLWSGCEFGPHYSRALRIARFQIVPQVLALSAPWRSIIACSSRGLACGGSWLATAPHCPPRRGTSDPGCHALPPEGPATASADTAGTIHPLIDFANQTAGARP